LLKTKMVMIKNFHVKVKKEEAPKIQKLRTNLEISALKRKLTREQTTVKI